MTYNVRPHARAGVGNSESISYGDTIGALASFLARRAPDDPDWSQALCKEVDPELWFPPLDGDNGQAAKMICARCPILEECKAYAMARPELQGVWGGTTTAMRKRSRADQRLARVMLQTSGEDPVGDVRHVA